MHIIQDRDREVMEANEDLQNKVSQMLYDWEGSEEFCSEFAASLISFISTNLRIISCATGKKES